MRMLIINKTRENIDRYCEKFEKDMLHLFDRAYRRGDPKMMHVRIGPYYERRYCIHICA